MPLPSGFTLIFDSGSSTRFAVTRILRGIRAPGGGFPSQFRDGEPYALRQDGSTEMTVGVAARRAGVRQAGAPQRAYPNWEAASKQTRREAGVSLSPPPVASPGVTFTEDSCVSRSLSPSFSPRPLPS